MPAIVLLRLAWVSSDVLEGNSALDLLAGKDGLVAPVDKDADVARPVG